MKVILGLIMIFLLVISITPSDVVGEGKASPVKISSIIQQWQLSSDLELFAQENGLKYADGKIRVYIYLDSPESISQLASDIEIISSVDNIVVATVSSPQITELSQADFVQKIDLPVEPDFSPPSTETPSTETPSTETPSTETPSTETPSTETPSTETPSTETPSTETQETKIDMNYVVVIIIGITVVSIMYAIKKKRSI